MKTQRETIVVMVVVMSEEEEEEEGFLTKIGIETSVTGVEDRVTSTVKEIRTASNDLFVVE